MRSIYKYPLQNRVTLLDLPEGALPLSVGAQESENGLNVVLWAEVDTDQPTTQRYFAVYGTGWELPTDRVTVGVPGANPNGLIPERAFIGTVQAPGALVWHVFELIEPQMRH